MKKMEKNGAEIGTAASGGRKRVEVVAAAIIGEGKVFATQRGYGVWRGWWEFPGGKIEAGESHEEALRRELREELKAEVEVGKKIATVEYDYDDFHLVMHLYECHPKGNLVLMEHMACRWLGVGEMQMVQWLPADEEVLPLVERLLWE